MRVGITGATGFLGKNLVGRLKKSGFGVVAMGRNRDALSGLAASNVEAVSADVRNEAQLARFLKSLDVVCHLAALASPWGRARDFYDINVQGSLNVLRACQINRVRRMVFVSSPSVLFDGTDLVEVTEEHPYPAHYISNYCASKKQAEETLRENAGDVELVIIRPKAIFGPGDTSLLPRVLDAARRKRLRIIGDGNNEIDLTFVDNVSDSIVLAMNEAGAAGRTYNITNDEHVRVWPFIENILTRLGLSMRGSIDFKTAFRLAAIMEACYRPLLIYEPPLTRLTVALLGRTQTFDISRARKELGYVPQVSVAEGLARTMQSLRGET
jgi:2-alkyl-3-oxoalkanoate reductase